jgi:hypothetical protein
MPKNRVRFPTYQLNPPSLPRIPRSVAAAVRFADKGLATYLPTLAHLEITQPVEAPDAAVSRRTHGADRQPSACSIAFDIACFSPLIGCLPPRHDPATKNPLWDCGIWAGGARREVRLVCIVPGEQLERR